MTDYLDIQGKLFDTNAAIAKCKSALARNPRDKGLALTIESLNKHFEDLERQFLKAARFEEMDVCNYRFDGDAESHVVTFIADTLIEFQKVVTLFYASKKEGKPRNSAKVGLDVTSTTRFRLGYTYSGSLGFVLALPNEEYLLGKTLIDEAIDLAFKTAKCKTSEDIVKITSEVGGAPIRAIYRWADSLRRSGLNVDVEWRSENKIIAEVNLPFVEADNLVNIISETSAETKEIIKITGNLFKIDHKIGKFGLEVGEGERIYGSLTEELKHKPQKTLGHYKSTLEKTTSIIYSQEQDKIEYKLIELIPIK